MELTLEESVRLPEPALDLPSLQPAQLAQVALTEEAANVVHVYASDNLEEPFAMTPRIALEILP